MTTSYTVRVVAKGSGTIMKRVSKTTLREARKEQSRLHHVWRDGGVRVEILRHKTEIVP